MVATCAILRLGSREMMNSTIDGPDDWRQSNSRHGFLRTSILLLLASLLVFSSGSLAWSNDWIVQRVSGKVYLVAPGVQAFRAKPGMRVEPGYTVATKARSKALIMRGEESIFVGPDTRFALSKYRSTSINTTLLQASGHLQIDVQRRAQPHFKVETPFLAAIVKGTKFDVRVSDRSARVDVSRGLVEVSDHSSGDRANVGAGESAASEPTRSVGLQVGGATTPTVVQGARKAPVFETPPVPNVPQAAPQAAPQASPEFDGRARSDRRSAAERFFSEEQLGRDRGRGRDRDATRRGIERGSRDFDRSEGRGREEGLRGSDRGRSGRDDGRGNRGESRSFAGGDRDGGSRNESRGRDRGNDRDSNRSDRNESRGNDRGGGNGHGGGRGESESRGNDRGGGNFDSGGGRSESRGGDRNSGNSDDGGRSESRNNDRGGESGRAGRGGRDNDRGGREGRRGRDRDRD